MRPHGAAGGSFDRQYTRGGAVAHDRARAAAAACDREPSVHEASVALHLTRLASDAFAASSPAAGERIVAVRVRVGVLSGVVPRALAFAWDAARAGTACAGAELVVDEVPARLRCPACAGVVDAPVPLRFRCPQCQAPATDVVSGRELELASLDVAAPDPEVVR